MEITESTKTIVGVTFAFLYEQMYDDKRRAIFNELVDNYVQVLCLIIFIFPTFENQVCFLKLAKLFLLPFR